MSRTHWKRNLVFIWLSQFCSLMGFSFAMPFAPFYMQELGVTDPLRLKLWVAVFAAATPLMIVLSAPVWGLMADRYGRKLMLLRANFAAAIVLVLMGSVHTVVQLIVLRLCQGAFTGTITAAQAMVAVDSPEEHSGRALGALSAAVYSGSMVGAFVGGLIADTFGYSIAFYCSGGLLVLAGLLAFGTREGDLVREDGPPAPTPVPAPQILRRKRDAWPFLAVLVALAFTRQFDVPYLPLLVQEIHGSIQGAAVWTGALSAVAGLAGLLAGFLLAPLADRKSPAAVGGWAAVVAGGLMIVQSTTHHFLPLFVARFGIYFCAGGIEPVVHAWLARATPPARRGAIFGLASSARSFGWMASSLGSGGVAAFVGIRTVFAAAAAMYLALPFALARLFRRPAMPPSLPASPAGTGN